MTVEYKEKTLVENYEALKATIEALKIDYEKFQDRKVKAAGGRVRNNLLNCKKLCDKIRKQVLVEIKEIPTKHRISDAVGALPSVTGDDTTTTKLRQTPVGRSQGEQAPDTPPDTVPDGALPSESDVALQNGDKRKRKANKKKL